eukprot:Nitzschia sp. Nitz4//scaffold95_size97785//33808//34947//NITZ4_004662-RA/size97785-processed-gene-0.38-mRNA-1//-1//CDS//3329560457//1213//frame0
MNDIQALEVLLASLPQSQPSSIPAQQAQSFASSSVSTAALQYQQEQAQQSRVRDILEEVAKSPQGNEILASLDAGTLSLCLKYLRTGGVPAAPPASFHFPIYNKKECNNLSFEEQTRTAVAGNHQVASPQSLLGIVPAMLPTGGPQDQSPSLNSTSPNSMLEKFLQAEDQQAAKNIGMVGGSSESEAPTIDGTKEKHLVANRLYAKRCRKRKKEYVEELKVENEQLRKLHQMLEVVPDLILSFDSSGTIRFATKSSMEFLGRSPQELIGSSFWRLLSTHSSKRLKNAFMDSLAQRKEGSSTLSLGDRVWEVSLKGEDLSSFPLLLRGKIFFQAGSTPECVCSIRHKDCERSTKPAAATALLDLRSQNDPQQRNERALQG